MVVAFKSFLVFVLHLVLLLDKVQVTGVPLLPKHASKALEHNPSTNRIQEDSTSRSSQQDFMNGALPEKGDLLDRVARSQNSKLAKQYRLALQDEALELAKYVRNGNQERYHQHTSAGRTNAHGVVKQQVEILTPHMPPFDVLKPSNDSSLDENGQVEESLEPSPSIGDEMIPYPTPEEATLADVLVGEIEPSYSPSPRKYESRPIHPSLVRVENEEGNITYKPWNSVYVFVRRVLGLSSQRKASKN